MPEIEKEEEKLENLERFYQSVLERLQEVVRREELTVFSYVTVRDMMNKVVQNLARKYEKIKEGIGGLMGGQVLDFEAKRIRDGARREGRKEGRIKTLIALVCKKSRKGNSPEEIADMLEEDETLIRKIYEAARKYAPDYDEDKIYSDLYEPSVMMVREESKYKV